MGFLLKDFTTLTCLGLASLVGAFRKWSNREKIRVEFSSHRTQDRNGFFSWDQHLVGVNSDLSFGSPLPTARMDRKRERYNARARQSVAGGTSHKKRRRRNANGLVGGDAAEAPIAVIPDPNAEIINLKPLEQKELERRERVKQQVCTPSRFVDASVSSSAVFC